MKLTFGLFAALALAACTTSAPVGAPPPAPAAAPTPAAAPFSPATVANLTVIDEKALYAAEALYNVPAHAYVAADSNGTLPVGVKAALKPVLVQAYAALKVARAAYAAGNATGFADAVDKLSRLSGEAKALLPGAK